jgi:hypothetical protein
MKAGQVKPNKPARSYWVEGLAALLGLSGLALILAPDRLRAWLYVGEERLKLGLSHSWAAFNRFLDQLSTAKVAGLMLLLAFLAIFAWRALVRLAESAGLSADACPSCGRDLHRIHRSAFDRLVSRVSGIPLRRYRCSDETCGWQGLCRRRDHHNQPINE